MKTIEFEEGELILKDEFVEPIKYQQIKIKNNEDARGLYVKRCDLDQESFKTIDIKFYDYMGDQIKDGETDFVKIKDKDEDGRQC